MTSAKFVVSALLIALGVSGCSSGGGKLAADSGAAGMPAGARWDGVYQGPYHIYLRIVTEGDRATGTWRAIGGREGQLSGTISGNVLAFDWSERATDSSEEWAGRGYFVYEISRRGGPHELHGEWGFGQGGAGNSWWAVKRSKLAPAGAGANLVDGDAGEDERADSDTCGYGCDGEEIDTDN